MYLNFLNFLVSDSIFLLDESLNRILQLKEMGKEMANTVEWERRSAQERQERTRQFHSQENIIPIGDGRCRHASTYFRIEYSAFSSSRDGPQRRSLYSKGPREVRSIQRYCLSWPSKLMMQLYYLIGVCVMSTENMCILLVV